MYVYFGRRNKTEKKHKAKLCSMFDHINQARTKCFRSIHVRKFLCDVVHRAAKHGLVHRDVIVCPSVHSCAILAHANTLVSFLSRATSTINEWCSGAAFFRHSFYTASLIFRRDYFIFQRQFDGFRCCCLLCCHCRIHRHYRCRCHCGHHRSISSSFLFLSLSLSHTLHAI